MKRSLLIAALLAVGLTACARKKKQSRDAASCARTCSARTCALDYRADADTRARRELGGPARRDGQHVRRGIRRGSSHPARRRRDGLQQRSPSADASLAERVQARRHQEISSPQSSKKPALEPAFFLRYERSGAQRASAVQSRRGLRCDDPAGSQFNAAATRRARKLRRVVLRRKMRRDEMLQAAAVDAARAAARPSRCRDDRSAPEMRRLSVGG